MKVALVHDYLIEYGGAERVLEALHELYPDAPVFTSFVNKKTLGIHWERFKNWDIRETWITKLPFYKKLHSPYRVFAPKAFAALDLSEFDIVISSSNAYYAKAVQVPNGVHICYCHTPPRALYGYATMSDWKQNPLFRVAGALINHYLRIVDFKVSQQVDYFVANSAETAARIKKFYRRDAEIIYPPVAVPENLAAQKNSLKLEGVTAAKNYYIYVNRLAFAKHPELAVRVCTKHNLPLVMVGDGKLRESLAAEAGPTIQFMGAVDDRMLHKLYAGAQALIYPVEDEDFGIVPIEAMGHGVPVIAHNSGGPKETIVAGKTGVLFDQLDEGGLWDAIQKFTTQKFNNTKIHQHALQFEKQQFKKKIQAFIALVNR